MVRVLESNKRNKNVRGSLDTMSSFCNCRHCFPDLLCPTPVETQWCKIKPPIDYQEPPALLFDLPDDIIVMIRKTLKKMVMCERPYKKVDDQYLDYKAAQWERQKQAIAFTTKKGVFTYDKKRKINGLCIWRCQQCFSETSERIQCHSCIGTMEEEDDYYYNTNLLDMLRES